MRADVENSFQNADVSGNHQTAGDRGIDVTAADMPESLEKREKVNKFQCDSWYVYTISYSILEITKRKFLLRIGENLRSVKERRNVNYSFSVALIKLNQFDLCKVPIQRTMRAFDVELSIRRKRLIEFGAREL